MVITIQAFPLENRAGVASQETVLSFLDQAIYELNWKPYHRGIEISVPESQVAAVLRILYRNDIMWYCTNEELEEKFFLDLGW